MQYIAFPMPFPFDEYKNYCIQNGVSGIDIDILTNYARRLDDQDLPVIFDIGHFSKITGVSIRKIKSLCSNSIYSYKIYKVRKKKNGFRYIFSPTNELRFLQKWINKNILVNIPKSEYCYSFYKGSNICKNASFHVGNDCLLQIDLFHFFESIQRSRVFFLFLDLGYERVLSNVFASLTTLSLRSILENGNYKDEFSLYFENKINLDSCFLPQGAITSPLISNLIAKKLDQRLSKLSTIRGVNYTRYADDITFSGNRSKLPSLEIIKKIVESEGFLLNESKIRLTPSDRRQIVTGICVNQKINVPLKMRKEIETTLYFCNKYGILGHIKYREINKKGFQDWLWGKICFVYSVNEELGKKYIKHYNRINWTI